ncbi:hypothetical protein F66182_2327 [Fusarium sp. NRRL 66182]|nr:hypothetical protein F66182_2327 [Fusarium sp. NRRL 66182]
MVPTVTYDGVPSAEGGNIFKDCKFWIAQRVPKRNEWIELIEQNGGEVKPLEKQADMLIADHARKDVPPGSYSWKFIDDSVKNGIVQIKDRYLIGRHPDIPRPVGSNLPKKSTRTPYTREDDARLAKWALAHADEVKGNKIWQNYERINPRHTAQSWRDRYLKKLHLLDRRELEKLAAAAPEEPNLDKEAAREVNPAQQPRNTPGRRPQPVVHRPAEQQTPKPRTKNPPGTARLDRQTPPPLIVEEDHQSQIPHEAEEQEDPPVTFRDRFYEDLDEYISVTGKDIKRCLTIDGKTIDLFDLAMAVKDAPTNHESQMANWFTIGEKLGFLDPSEDVVNELYLCHEENLMEFLIEMESFVERGDDEDAPESQETAPDMDTRQDIDFEDGQDGGLPQSYVRSSPPVAVAALKRNAGQHPLASSGHLNKRRCYHKAMEIPSTPDEKLFPQRPAAQEPSPSARKSSRWLDYVGESEASQHLPPLPPLQDESLDLGARPSQGQDARHQSIDLAPRSEHQGALDPTPIPFSLKKSIQERSSTKRGRESHAGPSRRDRDSSFTEQITCRRTVSTTKPKPKPAAQPAIRRSLPASFNSSRDPTPHNNRPRNSDNSNRREIQKWASHYESLGYPRHIVIEALERTTLTPGNLALTVMQHLSDGRDVPSHHEGIWTDRDDTDLQFVSGVDFSQPPETKREELEQKLAQKTHNRLIKKHGFQRFNLRRAFLEAQIMENREGLEE